MSHLNPVKTIPDMNTLHFMIGITAAILILPLCAESDGKKPKAAVEAKKMSNLELLTNSRKTWNALKKEKHDTYVYTVRKSYMMGNGNMTTLHVKNGSVVKRSFSDWKPGQEPVVRWTEVGKKLATNPTGAEILTIDDIYDRALKILQKKTKPMEKLYLKFDAQGVLKSCFTVNTMIADDAPINGVIVSSIKY